jgi:CRP-like cAMP-binding protein
MDLTRLEAIPLLAALPSGDRTALAALAREARADPGEVLVRDGVFAYELIAIESGEAELLRDGEHVAQLAAGDVLGEIGALERLLANATVLASSPMRLITLSALDLRRLRRSEPAAVARLQGLLLRRRTRLAAGRC